MKDVLKVLLGVGGGLLLFLLFMFGLAATIIFYQTNIPESSDTCACPCCIEYDIEGETIDE